MPAEVKTILDMKEPDSMPDVKRFLGTVNQLVKFVPNLAEKSKPLRDLLQKDVSWTWGKDQQDAKRDANSGFHQIKLDKDNSKLTTIITPYGRF